MDAGANTKVEISSGENPLYIAAQMGHIEIVKLILSKVKILGRRESNVICLKIGAFFFCFAAFLHVLRLLITWCEPIFIWLTLTQPNEFLTFVS